MMTSSPALRSSAAAPGLLKSCSPTSAASDTDGEGRAYNNDKGMRSRLLLVPSSAGRAMMAPVCMLFLLGALAWTVAGNQASAGALADGVASPWRVGAKAEHPTLVIYVYSATDPGEVAA